MEYSDVVYHSSVFFELSLKFLPVMEYSDVIYHSSAFLS